VYDIMKPTGTFGTFAGSVVVFRPAYLF